MADPAFRGFVESTLDALLVFEGCKRGYLPKISRRLQDYEKKALVLSGAIFVFDEEETGIKRWTDGLSWSPSRTLGNFLVYRELDKKASSTSTREDEDEPVIEKNLVSTNAMTRSMGGLTSKSDPLDDANDLAPVPSTSSAIVLPANGASRQRSLSEVAGVLQMDRARERALVGSLTSSYRFRSDGLVKKTISLSGLHLVAYYRLDDVTSGRLRTPSSHTELMSLEVSPGFLTPSLFRMPPVVEVGLDGQIRYKGESDTPISPLTRSGSSQGFPTPNLNPSRPPSSDPYSTAPSHFTPLLGTRPPSRDYPAAPGSPRRGATATARSTNRFDPYSVGRYSPNASVYAAATAYPFTGGSTSQPSPHQSTFSPMVEYHRRDSSGEGRQVAQAVDDLSTSAPSQRGWPGQARGSSQNTAFPDVAPARTRADISGESSANYYQPRHPTPYAPSSESTSSTGVFAYNPPSTGPPARRASEGVPNPLNSYHQLSHQQSTMPARPASQQYQPSSAPFSSSLSNTRPGSRSATAYSRYLPADAALGPPRETAHIPPHQARHHPAHSSILPSQQNTHALSSTSSARNSPAPPASTDWTTVDYCSATPHGHPHLVPNTRDRPLQAPPDLRSAYAPSLLPPTASSYPYEAVHQANGLVVGFNDKQHAAIQGLGVSATEGVHALGLYQPDDSFARSQSAPRALDHAHPPPLAGSSAHQAQHAYADTPASSATSMPTHRAYNYDELGIEPNHQNGWQEAPSHAPENGGWWSPNSLECAESFWPGQVPLKRDHS